MLASRVAKELRVSASVPDRNACLGASMSISFLSFSLHLVPSCLAQVTFRMTWICRKILLQTEEAAHPNRLHQERLEKSS